MTAIPKQKRHHAENLKKKLHKYAEKIGLEIIIEDPSTRIDFLDLEFDLCTHKYKPYKKPNNKLRYINYNSNHPKTILNAIPKMISTRLSKRSSGKDEFEEASKEYNIALKENGYKEQTNYIAKDQLEKKNDRKRKRKIIWYNPPYCQSVKTNVGRIYINLVKKHFTKSNPLTKIINKNNMKISYSCMENIKRIISSHNSKILSEKENKMTNKNKNEPNDNNKNKKIKIGSDQNINKNENNENINKFYPNLFE